MAKRFRMNLTTGDFSPLSGTDLLPHPGNFPLGSVESRAAARALVEAGRLRSGDQGTFKCGCTWTAMSNIDSEGHELGGVVLVILPKDFSEETLSSEHLHDHSLEAVE